MTEEEKEHFLSLAKTDSSRVIADKIKNDVGDNQEFFNFLFSICLSEPYPISMRTAHAMQFCCIDYPQLMKPFYTTLVNEIINTKMEGVRRSFLKIISECIDPFELEKDRKSVV